MPQQASYFVLGDVLLAARGGGACSAKLLPGAAGRSLLGFPPPAFHDCPSGRPLPTCFVLPALLLPCPCSSLQP